MLFLKIFKPRKLFYGRTGPWSVQWSLNSNKIWSFDEYDPELYDQVLYNLDINSSLFDFGEWEPGPDSDTNRKGSPDSPVDTLIVNQLGYSPEIPKRNAEFVELNNDKWIETIPIHLATILVDYPSQGSTDRPPRAFVSRWSPLRIPWSATRWILIKLFQFSKIAFIIIMGF